MTTRATSLTWRQLDERSGGLLTDVSPYGLECDLDESGMTLDDQIIDCWAVQHLVKVLEEIGASLPNNHEAEYLDNRRLIQDINVAITVGTF